MENIRKYTFIKQGAGTARSLLIASLLVSAFGCTSNQALDEREENEITRVKEEKKNAENDLSAAKEKNTLLKKIEGEKKELEQKIDKKRIELADLKAKLGNKDTDLNQRDEDVASLEQKIRELEAEKQKLEQAAQNMSLQAEGKKEKLSKKSKKFAAKLKSLKKKKEKVQEEAEKVIKAAKEEAKKVKKEEKEKEKIAKEEAKAKKAAKKAEAGDSNNLGKEGQALKEEDKSTKKWKSTKKLEKSVDEAEKAYNKAETKEKVLEQYQQSLQGRLNEALARKELLDTQYKEAYKTIVEAATTITILKSIEGSKCEKKNRQDSYEERKRLESARQQAKETLRRTKIEILKQPDIEDIRDKVEETGIKLVIAKQATKQAQQTLAAAQPLDQE
jgi:hypothetical protein